MIGIECVARDRSLSLRYTDNYGGSDEEESQSRVADRVFHSEVMLIITNYSFTAAILSPGKINMLEVLEHGTPGHFELVTVRPA